MQLFIEQIRICIVKHMRMFMFPIEKLVLFAESTRDRLIRTERLRDYRPLISKSDTTKPTSMPKFICKKMNENLYTFSAYEHGTY